MNFSNLVLIVYEVLKPPSDAGAERAPQGAGRGAAAGGGYRPGTASLRSAHPRRQPPKHKNRLPKSKRSGFIYR